ncbi:MAG: cysteine desulfurase [Clostridiales bacterium]|nr:cysteine desulfurase [Clostridiales bacterium]
MYEDVIYLDNCATTRLLHQAAHALAFYGSHKYFNPSALYRGAVDVYKDVVEARKTIAWCLGCGEEEIIFTSGGSESNNTAIFGSVRNKKGRVITSLGEHMSVYAPFNELKSRGFDVQFARIDKCGRVDIEHFKSLLSPDTVFVSAIHASNETGAVNDIGLISRLCKQANPDCVIHADGTQAFLKAEFEVGSLGIDLYTISGHKVHAPKGIGALYVRKGVKINLLVYGASQEYGMRAGTENAGAICAFAAAVRILHGDIRQRIAYYRKLRELFISTLKKNLGDFLINCEEGLPNIISLSIAGVKSEILIQMLSDKGIYVASGSACSSRQKVSRVLKEMGVGQKYIEGSIRVSFSQFNTEEEVQLAAEAIADTANRLRKMIRK